MPLPSRRIAPFAVLGMAVMLQGCLAKAAADVVTAPVRVASKAVDLATNSQSERDEKRGREIRKGEEQLGKLERRYKEEYDNCIEGSRSACKDARATYAEMQELSRTLPLPPRSNPER